MHDPRRHRALATIATIRDAQRAVARHELFLAREREREAQAAREQANSETMAAAHAWETHLGEHFHPELAAGLASELMTRVEAGAAARDQAIQMTEGREARETEWRLGDARCRQADQALDRSRRARARHREERALEALADRVSFDWSRP